MNNLGTIFLEVLGQRPIMTSSKPKIRNLHTYSSTFTNFNNLARLLTILSGQLFDYSTGKKLHHLHFGRSIIKQTDYNVWKVQLY